MYAPNSAPQGLLPLPTTFAQSSASLLASPSKFQPATCGYGTATHVALARVLQEIEPDQKLKMLRHTMINVIQQEVDAVAEFRGAKVGIFGSVAYGLDLRDSDTDLSILCIDVVDFVQAAQLLVNRFKSNSLFTDVMFVRNAKIPIIRLKCAEAGLHFDIAFSQDKASLKSRTILVHYAVRNQELPALARLVKHWVKQRQLPDSRHGGLSSYAWTLLIIQFLQVRELMLRMNPFAASGLVEMLRDFFYTYATSTWLYVVSVNSGRFLMKTEKKWPGERYAAPDALSIEDPVETNRDLGQSLSKSFVMQMRCELARATSIIGLPPAAGEGEGDGSMIHRLFSTAAEPVEIIAVGDFYVVSVKADEDVADGETVGGQRRKRAKTFDASEEAGPTSRSEPVKDVRARFSKGDFVLAQVTSITTNTSYKPLMPSPPIAQVYTPLPLGTSVHSSSLQLPLSTPHFSPTTSQFPLNAPQASSTKVPLPLPLPLQLPLPPPSCLPLLALPSTPQFNTTQLSRPFSSFPPSIEADQHLATTLRALLVPGLFCLKGDPAALLHLSPLEPFHGPFEHRRIPSDGIPHPRPDQRLYACMHTSFKPAGHAACNLNMVPVSATRVRELTDTNVYQVTGPHAERVVACIPDWM